MNVWSGREKASKAIINDSMNWNSTLDIENTRKQKLLKDDSLFIHTGITDIKTIQTC